MKILHRFLKWRRVFHKRNILLESCFYDSEKAEKDLEEYKKKTGLSILEIACGIKSRE